MTNHLSEEELILHYYGESAPADQPSVAAHLTSCGECQVADSQLRRVLALADTAAPVEARPGFERDVWARLEPHLEANRGSWRALFWFPQWALGGVVAALVLLAFVAGRISTGDPTAGAPATAAFAEAAPERVLHAAVGDHLDRTQIMLAELVNADQDQPDVFAGEQARASDLVAANRLIRQSATRSGDADIADVLDDLERVLLEIANAPAEPTSNELTDLQSRITTQDLLFKVRAIAEQMRQRDRRDGQTGEPIRQRLPMS